MNLPFKLSGIRWSAFFLAGLVFPVWLPRAQADLPPNVEAEYRPVNGEFDGLGQPVVQLLRSRDTNGFATNFCVTAADWQAITTTNLPDGEADRLHNFAKGADRASKRLTADAQAVVSRADSLHLDFSDNDWHARIVTPRHVGQVIMLRAANLTLPYVETLDVLVVRDTGTNSSAGGDFKLTVRGLEKFPSGWRISTGIQWTSFPTNVADAKTLRKLTMLDKMAAFKSITAQDDPTLLTLGESLVSFISDRDPAGYERELLLNSNEVWAMFEKSGRQGPTRQEVNEDVGKEVQDQVAGANKILQQMSLAGIDLKAADIQIKNATMEHCQSQGGAGSLEPLIGQQFKLVLTVKTDAKAKNGNLLSGDYVLAVKQIMKLEGAWKVAQDIQWEKLPEGVVDSQTAANMEFENYVAKYRALPPGTVAPEIEFTTLVGEKKIKLSDLRGKVVVLDFGATWCGPCQEPMADLQKIRTGHPAWQDRVAVIPVSIDDTADIVRQHVNQRSWTNNFNVWAGDGGWRSAPAKAFRVTSVPTSYVIDQQGKIKWGGHPEGGDIAATVDQLLVK